MALMIWSSLTDDDPKSIAMGVAIMLETARVGSDGLKGAIRIKGLTAIYLITLRTWLQDESADMARTMAALDGYQITSGPYSSQCCSAT